MSTNSDDGSSYSGSSARRSGRVSKAPQRLIAEDPISSEKRRRATQRKQNSRSRVANMSPQRKSDIQARDQQRHRVANMSPQRQIAERKRKRVTNMSPQRKSDIQARDQQRHRVANMSPQRQIAERERKLVANMYADSESSDVEPPSAESKDAHNYAKAIQATCDFFMCAVCAWEGGLDSMIHLNDGIRDMLSKNTTLPEEFFQLRSDESEDGIDYNYRRRVCIEMEEPGVLKNIRHICSNCHGKAKSGKSTSRTVIPYSLAGGLFCGEPIDRTSDPGFHVIHF
jgi:hypothetical protein